MEWRYFDACDVQLEESVARCGVCRGEIYRCDPVAAIDGTLVHEHCMTAEDLEYYPLYPACSYLEEAC